jgi:hypothetical protein
MQARCGEAINNISVLTVREKIQLYLQLTFTTCYPIFKFLHLILEVEGGLN